MILRQQASQKQTAQGSTGEQRKSKKAHKSLATVDLLRDDSDMARSKTLIVSLYLGVSHKIQKSKVEEREKEKEEREKGRRDMGLMRM